MDMMFVHDEGLRDERKTLIGFDRQFLIAGREMVLPSATRTASGIIVLLRGMFGARKSAPLQHVL